VICCCAIPVISVYFVHEVTVPRDCKHVYPLCWWLTCAPLSFIYWTHFLVAGIQHLDITRCPLLRDQWWESFNESPCRQNHCDHLALRSASRDSYSGREWPRFRRPTIWSGLLCLPPGYLLDPDTESTLRPSCDHVKSIWSRTHEIHPPRGVQRPRMCRQSPSKGTVQSTRHPFLEVEEIYPQQSSNFPRWTL
jgi:hypothetical protein